MAAPLLLQRVFNKLGHPFGINPFPRAFENPFASSCSDPQALFDHIHRANFWSSAESRSGVGSETSFAGEYLLRLQDCLRRWQFTSLFDAPCGDLNWILSLATGDACRYLGGDLSVEVVESARVKHPTIDLQVFDICADPFPEVEVWHCRDCLFHLPIAAIHQAFANFSRSSIPYALITTHRARWLHANLDVGLGGFRLLDLERPPFSLPAPLEYLADYRLGRDFPRYVCLWERDQIADSLSRWVSSF